MKQAFKTFLFLVVLFIALLLMFELMLGIVFRIKDRNIEPADVVDFPYVYFTFHPQKDIDQYGLKNRYPLEKPANTVRVMLIGGSVARGKEPGQTIAAYLEELLNQHCTGIHYQVINGGISAFVVEQEFIFTQMVFMQYQPDIIIGIDGYNDLLGWKINRFTESPFPLPPHNWKDFRVIALNRKLNSLSGRLSLFFHNISRMVDFFRRKIYERRFPVEEADSVALSEIAETYCRVVDDLYHFCKSRNVHYYSFFQPVRFYDNPEFQSPEHQKLSELYAMMIASCKNPYVYDLSSIFREKQAYFIDDCHLIPEGHREIATAIYDSLMTVFCGASRN